MPFGPPWGSLWASRGPLAAPRGRFLDPWGRQSGFCQSPPRNLGRFWSPREHLPPPRGTIFGHFSNFLGVVLRIFWGLLFGRVLGTILAGFLIENGRKIYPKSDIYGPLFSMSISDVSVRVFPNICSSLLVLRRCRF